MMPVPPVVCLTHNRPQTFQLWIPNPLIANPNYTRTDLTYTRTPRNCVQGEIFDTANKQLAAIVKAAKALINGELTRRSKPKKKQFDKSAVTAALRQELLRLFDQSPLGVMRVLEANSNSEDDEARLKRVDEEIKSFVIKQLVTMLPSEFQRFHHLSAAVRAKEAA
jgi:hypothetical protein